MCQVRRIWIFVNYAFVNACDGKNHTFSLKVKQTNKKSNLESILKSKWENFYQKYFLDLIRDKSQSLLALETSTVKRTRNCLTRSVEKFPDPTLTQ